MNYCRLKRISSDEAHRRVCAEKRVLLGTDSYGYTLYYVDPNEHDPNMQQIEREQKEYDDRVLRAADAYLSASLSREGRGLEEGWCELRAAYLARKQWAEQNSKRFKLVECPERIGQPHYQIIDRETGGLPWDRHLLVKKLNEAHEKGAI